MREKEVPSCIRVHGRLYRRADEEALHSTARRMVGQLARVLEVAADDADTLKRVLEHTTPGDVKTYDRAAHHLTQLAAPMEAAEKSFRRAVRSLVRADILDPATAVAYFPWMEKARQELPAEEGREPVEGGGVTDYKAPPGSQSVNDTLYPFPLKTLHWSSVPTAIKVKGHIYRRVDAVEQPEVAEVVKSVLGAAGITVEQICSLADNLKMLCEEKEETE